MDDTERYLFLALQQAVEDVDLALNQDWGRKKQVLAELRQALERGH